MPRGDKTRAAAAAVGGGGVVTRAALRAAGISPRLAEREAAAGRWMRGATGIYVPHPPPALRADLVQVARAHVGGRFLVSGLLPLAELRLRWLPPVAGIHVLVPDDVRETSGGLVRVSRTGCIGELETWTRLGAHMVDPERAVVDAARYAGSLREARGIVLGAVADRWASVDGLREQLSRCRRNGSGYARRAVLDAERGCASPPEAELVDALLGRGVPFLVNPEVRVDGVLVGFPDVWIVGTAVTGEVESVERHGELDDRTATYDRHETFTAVGLEPVHLSVRRIRRPGSDAAAYLLARAAGCAKPVPAGLTVTPRGPLLS